MTHWPTFRVIIEINATEMPSGRFYKYEKHALQDVLLMHCIGV